MLLNNVKKIKKKTDKGSPPVTDCDDCLIVYILISSRLLSAPADRRWPNPIHSVVVEDRIIAHVDVKWFTTTTAVTK